MELKKKNISMIILYQDLERWTIDWIMAMKLL